MPSVTPRAVSMSYIALPLGREIGGREIIFVSFARYEA